MYLKLQWSDDPVLRVCGNYDLRFVFILKSQDSADHKYTQTHIQTHTHMRMHQLVESDDISSCSFLGERMW